MHGKWQYEEEKLTLDSFICSPDCDWEFSKANYKERTGFKPYCVLHPVGLGFYYTLYKQAMGGDRGGRGRETRMVGSKEEKKEEKRSSGS